MPKSGKHVKVEAQDFMCRCDKKGIARCDSVRARARAIVGNVHPVTGDLDFVNRMLYWLAFEGNVEFGADQWGGVFVTPFAERMEESPGSAITPEIIEETRNKYAVKTGVFIQCDDMVDGLAAAVVHIFDLESKSHFELASE